MPAITPESFLKEQIGKELIGIAGKMFALPPTLTEFVKRTSTIECERWQEHLCARLEKLPYQTGQRLAIHKPPQRGGSIIVSQRFPAYCLGIDPAYRYRQVTYNQTHSEMFSDVVQNIIRSPEYHEMFPKTKIPKQTSISEWSTSQRVARKDAQPSYMALGLQSGSVGVGGDTWSVDDPYASFEDAKSPLINQKIRDWHRYVLMPRVGPQDNIILMYHRWHPDDYAGWLIEQGGWEVIRYADLGDCENDPMEREFDEPLSPRTTFEFLDALRNSDPLVFAGLHQGKPTLPEGNAIKRAWFEKEPGIYYGSFDRDKIKSVGLYWDLGGSDAKNADRTVGTFGAKMRDHLFYWFWQHAGQWNPLERDDEIIGFSLVCNKIFPGIGVYLEASIGLGVDSVTQLKNRLMSVGINVKVDHVRTSKYERATAQHDSFLSAAEAGRVRLYDGDAFLIHDLHNGAARWIEPYLTEVTRLQVKQTDKGIVFVGGKDDRFDSGVGLHNKLTNKKERLSMADLQVLAAAMGR